MDTSDEVSELENVPSRLAARSTFERRHRALVVTAVVFALLAVLGFVATTLAYRDGRKWEERSFALQAENEELESALHSNQADLAATLTDLESSDRRLAAVETDFEHTRQLLKETRDETAALERRLADSQADLERSQSALRACRTN